MESMRVGKSVCREHVGMHEPLDHDREGLTWSYTKQRLEIRYCLCTHARLSSQSLTGSCLGRQRVSLTDFAVVIQG